MTRRPFGRLAARLLSLLVLVGCARDGANPVAPTAPPKPSASLLGALLPVKGVTRVTPLTTDITVSAVIDSRGGTLTIPEAGLTLVVPRNAVSSKTRFKATALAGRLVAYEFEPHGTKFAVPLKFSQDLRKVTLTGWLTSPLMQGAYFADKSQLDQDDATAVVNELLPATLDLLRFRVSFDINHFSGYLVSWQ
jgi:hypothetical protein